MSEEEIKDLVLEFHNTYEELSTNYGYETRKDTRKFDFNSPNGKLMYATIEKVVVPKLQQKENIIKEVREFAKLRKEMYERQENALGQEVIISLLEILDKDN